ncbi:uncharacterized protein LOC129318863 [Prosopis cineraria]|uniref:uncharacterized protein LOC129318863 n=1 Tax=Prosopis cineraria TaxID=364024 RepID=UPI00240EC6F4|nr:uncharacterized protein LOC129318863 [Prosopis cineraria]
MASSTTASRLIAVLLGFLALTMSTTARPCRTFFISSYSFSFRPQSSAATLTAFEEFRSLVPHDVAGNNDNNYDNLSYPAEIFFDGVLTGYPLEEEEHEAEIELRASQIRAPFGFLSHNFSSFRDRTQDIMSVVLALLFGAAGGALTAVGLYLIWSVLSDRYDYGDSYDDYVDQEKEIDSPRKTGFMKIPAFESAPAPAQESV